MPKYELPISPNYVADWDLVAAVREIFQNALDQQTANPDNEMLVHYDPELQQLRIGNRDSTLAMSTLVLGNSSKTKRDDMIGQFGEGYKLALVVLLRLGKSVTIYNNPSVWTPEIVRSEVFETPVLSIHVAKYRFKTCPEHDLMFTISGITPEEFEQIKARNLYFHEIDLQKCILHEFGTIHLDEKYKGQVFVSGLYVTTLGEAHYGYDFRPGKIKIGRDRDLVSDHSIFWETSHMWASQSGHARLVELMLETKAPDVQSLEYHVYAVPKETVHHISCSWYKEHGCAAYPVASQKEAEKARAAFGKDLKMVIVSEQLLAILKRSEQYKGFTAASIIQKSPHDLMKKVLRHKDKFNSCFREDLLALAEMSKYWGWRS